MTEKINLQYFYQNSEIGIQRVFDLLSASGDVTKATLKSKDGISYSNYAFADLLKSSFKQVDKNKDSTLSDSEIEKFLTTVRTQGFTYQQLVQLSSKYGTNNESIKMILSNFEAIDKNRDGRISQKEINSYSTTSQLEKEISEITAYKASDVSSFYDEGDETSSEADPLIEI